MGLTTISDGLITTAKANPLTTTLGAAGVGVVVGLGTAAVVGAVKSRKTKRSKTRNSRKRSGRARDMRYKSKQKHEQKYKRKRRYKIYGKKGWINPKRKHSKRRGKVYYAKKTGQPYIILSSGKAKFIKGKRRKK